MCGTVLTQPSTAYDDLITQRTDAQGSVSSLQQQISDYQTRLDKLQNTPLGSKKEEEKVETDMKNVCDKMNQLINDVNETADDYFETASYTNAYNILVPASISILYQRDFQHDSSDAYRRSTSACSISGICSRACLHGIVPSGQAGSLLL